MKISLTLTRYLLLQSMKLSLTCKRKVINKFLHGLLEKDPVVHDEALPSQARNSKWNTKLQDILR